MKLQSQDNTSVVDFYPTKTFTGNVSKEWFLKTITIQVKTLSKVMLNRIEMNLEVQTYLNNDSIPFEVVDFNTLPQFVEDHFVQPFSA